MSSLPILLHIIDELDRENKSAYYGNDFGFGISPYHVHRLHHAHRPHEHPTSNVVNYGLPLSLLSRLGELQLGGHAEKKDGSVSQIGKNGFQVCMDVGQFKPSELNVKVVDNSILIEGKHEEREDQHGFIERHFVRRYVLPQGYDAEKVVSTLSSDGVLTVSVPKPPQIEDKTKERVIQIQQTGPAHLNVKQNSQDKVGDANGTNGTEEKNK